MTIVWSHSAESIDWHELEALYRAAPLGTKPARDLQTVYRGSRYCCFARDGGALVAAGRALADGTEGAYVCDVAVLPSHQGRGLGQAVMRRLVERSSGHKSQQAQLDHTLVASRDPPAAADLLAALLGVATAPSRFGPFHAVFVNDGLTLDFDRHGAAFPVQHFCFRFDDAGFDELVSRLEAHRIAWRSTPHGAVDGAIDTQHGGRILYWSEPDGHVWEALTLSYARQA